MLRNTTELLYGKSRHTIPLIILGLSLVAVTIAFSDGLSTLISKWLNSEEYGHGLLMPFVSTYILWLRRSEIFAQPLKGSWLGALVIVFCLILNLAAVLADLESVKHYAYFAAIGGFILLAGGWRLLKIAAVPLLLLFLVVPLPYLLISSLTILHLLTLQSLTSH